MFCAGRVDETDLKRTMKACGGAVMTTAHDLNDSTLGTCEQFIEKQVGAERCVFHTYNFFIIIIFFFLFLLFLFLLFFFFWLDISHLLCFNVSDLTFLLGALLQRLAQLFSEEARHNSSKKPNGLSMTPSWLSGERSSTILWSQVSYVNNINYYYCYY